MRPHCLQALLVASAMWLTGCASDADGHADLLQWLRIARQDAARLAPRLPPPSIDVAPTMTALSVGDFSDGIDPFSPSNIATAFRRGDAPVAARDLAPTGQPATGQPRMIGTLQRGGKRYVLLQTGPALRAVAAGDVLADGPYRVRRIGTASAELQAQDESGERTLHVELPGSAR